MINKTEIFPIGIGTWKIDHENFEKDIDGLLRSYDLGQNYLSLYMMYNDGKVVKEMKKFINRIERETVYKRKPRAHY